jgi:hypothetical protein
MLLAHAAAWPEIALASKATTQKRVRTHVPAKPRFQVTTWDSLADKAPGTTRGGLALDMTAATTRDVVEEMTVYGRRRGSVGSVPDGQDMPTGLGPIMLSGTTDSRQSGFSGMTVTAAVPIASAPGLDAVLNLSGGHDALSATTTKAAAAATMGVKLAF